VLSGNRNFEARIHPLARANYLMSPPLVVAYAIAGHIGIDLTREPLGADRDGKPVMLADIWPSGARSRRPHPARSRRSSSRASYADLFQGGADWNALGVEGSTLFPWDPESTYIRRPALSRRLRARSRRDTRHRGRPAPSSSSATPSPPTTSRRWARSPPLPCRAPPLASATSRRATSMPTAPGAPTTR
jgi:aconitase A